MLLLGARSNIALATAEVFARAGWNLQLAARNAETLQENRGFFEEQFGVSVTLCEFDVLAISDHLRFIEALPELPDAAICCVGALGDQEHDQAHPADAVRIMRTNYEGPAQILEALAGRFAQRGSGALVGVSSVAGDRGRASNYIYGSAKAGFTAFLSGLRARLVGSGVHVVTVLPGFVATKMISHLQTPKPLTASPEAVGRAIYRSVLRCKNRIYVGKLWAPIMWIMRHLPEALFKRIRF
ncbi:MAG: SDR family oxidoreductase [Gammaproteobacteria bacterium AqS3]|nr:SDR family oxidoreductase [Gammaproteobacteria bacterium AqS3]